MSTIVATAERPQPASRSLYTALAAEIRESGLMRRRYVWYWTRLVAVIAAFFGLWVLFVGLGNSWFQLILAGAFGVLVTQFGFLGHDAAHRQIFRSAAWNDWTSRVLATLAGLSHGWWRGKHNRHHGAPNQEGRDPDIAPGVVAFTPAIVAIADRCGGLAHPAAGLAVLPPAHVRGHQPARGQRPAAVQPRRLCGSSGSSPPWSRSGSWRTSRW